MFNSERPSLEQLPSNTQLLRSTVLAAICAVAILFTIVLPAEYGVDPTGAGRVLGLTEMGEIKMELQEEAEQDRLLHGQQEKSSGLLNRLLDVLIASAHAAQDREENIKFTLAPGESAEIKLVMRVGDSARYEWQASGGRINFDLHGHGKGKSATYKKGRGATADQGEITAQFDGEHGWFWRNRDKKAVTVSIKVVGSFSKLVQQN